MDAKDIEENKLIAAVGYLGILFLVPLLAKKDSPFAQYHAKQGFVLFIAGIIASFLFGIPILGTFLLGPIAWIITVILFIMGLVNVFGGKATPLPIIGKFAENLKF